MRRLSTLALLFGLGIAGAGCSKKDSPQGADPTKGVKVDPATDTATERNKQLAGLKSTRQETRQASIEELSWLAEDDPAVLPALVELLKDKGTAGAGKTLANQINSTREAAALAIMACTKGEAVMKERGLPALREGLTDQSPALREHTAYTIGLIGPVAKPLAADVQKLCTDPDENVRGAAFDALRAIGIADPVALVKLLNHQNEEVVRLAAELVPLIAEMPAEAVGPLSEALKSENTNTLAAAANGLAAVGPKAASAVPLLVEAIKKHYPATFELNWASNFTVEYAYWNALVRIGEPAVGAVLKLLDHTNTIVQSEALDALGAIGPPARSAADELKKRLARRDDASLKAAYALVRIGESKDQALALLKEGLQTQNAAAGTIRLVIGLGDEGKPLHAAALANLTSTDAGTLYGVLDLIATLPAAEATKLAAEMGKLATDENKFVRTRLGRVLERLGPAAAPAAEALGKALATEKELDVRNQFVEALVAMGAGAKPGLPGLLPLVTDQDLNTSLRTRALAAVVVADPGSPEVAAALIKAAADDVLDIRAAAADAMSKLNPLPPDALNTLVKLAKSDGRYTVRVAALRALTTAGPRAKPAKAEVDSLAASPQSGLALWAKVAGAALDGDVNKIAPTVRTGLNDRNAQTRAAAAEALLVIGPTSADLPALLKLMKDQSGVTKAASATAAGRLGASAKDAVLPLKRLLDDREIEVRVAAADALGLIGPASLPAATKLKELLTDPSVKLAAQRALDKISPK